MKDKKIKIVVKKVCLLSPGGPVETLPDSEKVNSVLIKGFLKWQQYFGKRFWLQKFMKHLPLSHWLSKYCF